MSKVTENYRVTLPKALAERYGIRPGDEVRFEAAGDAIRLVPEDRGASAVEVDTASRLRLFDAATARQRAREAGKETRPADSRGWTREELYDRSSRDAD